MQIWYTWKVQVCTMLRIQYMLVIDHDRPLPQGFLISWFWFGGIVFGFGEPTIKTQKGSRLDVGGWTQCALMTKIFWLVLSDEQMKKKTWQFSLLDNEEMSNWLGVEHFPVFRMGWNQLDSQSSRNAFHSLSCSSNAYGRSFDCELRPREGTDQMG